VYGSSCLDEHLSRRARVVVFGRQDQFGGGCIVRLPPVCFFLFLCDLVAGNTFSLSALAESHVVSDVDNM
jgi:hypothetical protein